MSDTPPIDGEIGPRTYFAIELFNAQDDKKALRAIARREFEAKMVLIEQLRRVGTSSNEPEVQQ